MLVHAALAALREFAHEFRAVDPALLAAALACQLLNMVLRAAAWRNVLRAAYPEARVCRFHVAAAYVTGAAVNGITVGRLGDVLKVVIARTHIKGSTAPGIAGTIAVISVFNGFASAVVIGAAWYFGAIPDLPMPPVVPLAAGFAVALCALGVVMAVAGERLVRLVRQTLRRAVEGLAVLRMPGRYLREVAAVQALAWCARVGVVFLLLQAFHIPASLGDALLVIVLGSVASAVPAGPGGVGVQQVAVVVALADTTTAAAALSFGIGMQICISLVNGSLGLVGGAFLFRTVRPRAMLQRARGAAAAE